MNAARLGRVTGLSGLAAAALGVVLLLGKAALTGSYDWQPLQFPLAAPGERASAGFVPARSQVYEIALELDAVLPEATLVELLSQPRDPPVVDLRWTVSSEGRTLAQGTAGALLYWSRGGRTLAGQIRRWLVSDPFHRGGGSHVQVIGRVRCEAGRRYELAAELLGIEESLADANARIGVRLNRELWIRHTQERLIFAHAGLVLLALSGLLLGLSLLARLARGRGER